MLLSSSLCCFLLHVRDWILKYAFHRWDTFALFDIKDDWGDSIKYKPSSRDQLFEQTLRDNIKSFMENGTLID